MCSVLERGQQKVMISVAWMKPLSKAGKLVYAAINLTLVSIFVRCSLSCCSSFSTTTLSEVFRETYIHDQPRSFKLFGSMAMESRVLYVFPLFRPVFKVFLPVFTIRFSPLDSATDAFRYIGSECPEFFTDYDGDCCVSFLCTFSSICCGHEKFVNSSL